MADNRLRELEQLLRAAPDDPMRATDYLAACDRGGVLLPVEIRNRLLRVVYADSIPENLLDILEQYQGNRNRLQQFGIVTTPENSDQSPYIVGIDGKQYLVPTFEQIITHLSSEDKEVIETIDQPKLLLTPFARSNLELGQQLTSQSGNLPQQHPLESTWDQNADRTGDLLYRVNQFTDPVGGMTKQQILQLPHEKNPFPGWNVLAVNSQPEIDRQTMVKEGGGYKNAHDFLEEYKDKNYDGLSPEDMFALHMLAMELGIPFDQKNGCWLLGCYLKSARAVPDEGWDGERARVDLDLSDPGDAWYNLGSRAARRVGSGR